MDRLKYKLEKAHSWSKLQLINKPITAIVTPQNDGYGPSAPYVVTLPATGTTLNGLLVDDGRDWWGPDLLCQCRFRYGTDPTLTAYTTTAFVNGLITGTPLSAYIEGLLANTAYYFQAEAVNSVDTSLGAIFGFITPEGLPVVETLAPLYVTRYNATLRGILDSDGGVGNPTPVIAPVIAPFVLPNQLANECDVGFIYGTDLSNINVNIDAGIGKNNQPFSYILSTLTPGTTYYFMAWARNSFGISYGEVLQFTAGTKLPPIHDIPEPPVHFNIANIGLLLGSGLGLVMVMRGSGAVLTKPIYNVLANAGHAMHYEDITRALVQQYPKLKATPKSVLSALRSRSDIFKKVSPGVYFLRGKVEGKSYPTIK